MKIAHVVDSLEIGGAETLVSQMCRAQRQQGHEPFVYAIRSTGPLGEQLRADGFNVRANLGRHLTDSSLALFRIFRKLRPDVVHLHNPTQTIYGAPAARFAGTKSIVSTRHSLVGPPRNLTVERKYSIAAMFCDWIVGICDATAVNILKARSAPEAKITRIYNGTRPLDRVDQAECPAKSGFTLLFVGRLEPVKNLAYMLQSFQAALSALPSLQLWIVGDGSQRSTLEQMCANLKLTENVTFWGQQLNVAPFFSAADVFTMSSSSEGLPMSLLQAFSLGLPAVVTDVGGMAEVVRLSQAGRVVSLNNPEEYGAAIIEIARTPNERQEFSKNAKQAFKEHFTLEAMVDSYMRLYETTPRAR